MVKLLIFVLLLNNPNGTQTVKVETGPLAAAECRAMEAGVRAQDWPVVGTDDGGLPVYKYWGICADPKLAGQLGGGWRDLAGVAADEREGAQQ